MGEQQVRDLLHRAVDGVGPGVRFEEVAARVDARRRRVRAGRAAGVTAAVAAVVLGVVGVPRVLGTHLSAPDGRPTPGPLPAGSIAFRDLAYAVPPGWYPVTELPLCGEPPARTVEAVDHFSYPVACPTAAPSQTATPPDSRTRVALGVLVGPVYGPGSDPPTSWRGDQLGGSQLEGRPVRWHGFTAWLSESSQGGATQVELQIPELNVTVSASAASPEAARALVDRASPRLGAARGIPAEPSLRSGTPLAAVQSADGSDPVGPTTISDRATAQRLATLLRSLPASSAGPERCATTFGRNDVLIGFADPQGGPPISVMARFGSCNQVWDGTGRVRSATPELRDTLRALRPSLTGLG